MFGTGAHAAFCAHYNVADHIRLASEADIVYLIAKHEERPARRVPHRVQK